MMMTDVMLRIDAAERQFLAQSLAADELWPPSEALMSLLREIPGGEVAGGPRLRALLLAMELRCGDGEAPLPLTVSELWLLDSLMIRRDLRREKLPDGRPLSELATKVWRLIVDVYEHELPLHLRREVSNAGDQDSDQDASEIIASAEALLRPGHRERAGEDMPPAAA